MSPKLRLLLKKVADGQMTRKAAALEMERNGIPLPETIKILLAKEGPEPDNDEGEYCTMSNEELERRHNVANVAEDNAEWLEQRRQEMSTLHKQTADSFSPMAEPEGGE